MQHLVAGQLFSSACVHELYKKKKIQHAQMIEPPLLNKHKAG